jgi:hypothetical protein
MGLGIGSSYSAVSAGRAAGDNYALSALRNRWRILYEVAKVVTLDFLLNGREQSEFLHDPLRARGNGPIVPRTIRRAHSLATSVSDIFRTALEAGPWTRASVDVRRARSNPRRGGSRSQRVSLHFQCHRRLGHYHRRRTQRSLADKFHPAAHAEFRQ